MIKLNQNTKLEEINIIKNPSTKTIVDRYLIVSGFSYNKDVIDIACGNGHGSTLLYNYGAKSVVGVDNNDESIEFALNKFENYKNIHFIKYDITTLMHIDKKFDIVCSIETFEHLPKNKIQIYLNNLKILCKDNGKIFITTPIRRTEKFVYNGGTHLYEYNETEFKEEIFNCFNKDEYMIDFKSIVEFRYRRFLQTDLIDGIEEASKLFFTIIQKI
jgi:2-polyprenyl-3-methyl-5-hydroxy-6-metoxy-1,4-benzoquinol methylase